jgi:hypothetical protein
MIKLMVQNYKNPTQYFIFAAWQEKKLTKLYLNT